MWNIYLRRGTIWSVKSINQYDEIYEGMSAGLSYVLILSIFTDQYNNQKFTYLKAREYDYKKEERYYMPIQIESKTWYIELDNLKIGDQRALNSYETTVSNNDLNKIIKSAKEYFNLNIKKEKEIKVEEKEIPQQRIYKFGIDVYVTENEHVSVNSKKQIILSKEAKDDIIYNSQTDEQIRDLCDKYKIYPLKAIKEIRNRLVYQHKQNEG